MKLWKRWHFGAYPIAQDADVCIDARVGWTGTPNPPTNDADLLVHAAMTQEEWATTVTLACVFVGACRTEHTTRDAVIIATYAITGCATDNVDCCFVQVIWC